MSRRGAIAGGAAFGAIFAMTFLTARPADAMAKSGADGARAFVCEFTDRGMAVMANRSVAFENRVQQFRDLFVASFDLPAIGMAALGSHWHDASPDQRARFLQLFERQQVLIFAGRFDFICQDRLTVWSADAGDGGVWRVPSRVERVNAGPILVDWSVRSSSDDWRVVDLAIDDVGMVFLLRADFGAVLRTNGDRFDILLAAMQRKIEELNAA